MIRMWDFSVYSNKELKEIQKNIESQEQLGLSQDQDMKRAISQEMRGRGLIE